MPPNLVTLESAPFSKNDPWLPPGAAKTIGNNVEANRNANSQDMYQINIRLDNGEYRSVTQDSVYDLRVGNRVRMVDGRVYRY